MVALNFDLRGYNAYINRTNVLLGSEDLSNLLNANALGNLPAVNINSNNALVNTLQTCRNGPMFMGTSGSEFSCRQLCGPNGRLLQIGPSEEVFSNGEKLHPGTWCTLQRPNCNLNTSYVVATANSIACRSRHPRIFGGIDGNRVIACNNEREFNIRNILWDNLHNTRVSEFTPVGNADDRLASGNFRYTCQFDDDDAGNQYVSHTIDRLHPMRNPCSASILRASRQIRLMPDGTCDCGNYADTRVRNRLENDLFSECTNCFNFRIVENDINQIGHRCFTMSSPYAMAFSSVPCMPSRIQSDGNFCESIDIRVQEQVSNRPFEFHPVIDRSGTLQMCDAVAI